MRNLKHNFIYIILLLILISIISYIYYYFSFTKLPNENFETYKSLSNCNQDFVIINNLNTDLDFFPDYNPQIGPLNNTPTKQICGCIWDNIDVNYN